jgi:hypothetical protein
LEFVVALICYGGLAFDLMVVPLLLWRRTRLIAFLALLSFHLANSQLFNIGVFPWFMIGASTVFFEPDWPRRALAKLLPIAAPLMKPKSDWLALQARLKQKAVPPAGFANDISRARRRGIAGLLGAYLAFQLLWPFRHFLYEGDPGWNGKGDLFAWRMMLYDKRMTESRFFTLDPNGPQSANGRKPLVEIDARLINQALNELQVFGLQRDPDLVLQLSRYLSRQLSSRGGPPAEIYVHLKVSYNTRAPQYQVDPETNLAAVERTLFGPTPWIVPLQEARR